MIDCKNCLHVEVCGKYSATGGYIRNCKYFIERQPVWSENEDHCICCGATIPEGRMVCPNCLVAVKEG